MKKQTKTVLYISQSFPYPPVGGGTIKTYNSLKILAKHYRIHAIFLCDTTPSRLSLKEVQKLGIRVTIVVEPKIADSVKNHIVAMAGQYLRCHPHYVYQYASKKMSNVVDTMIERIRPSIIHVDHLNISQYLPEKKSAGQKWLLEHHNVEFLVFLTRLFQARRPGQFIFLLIETFATFIYEWRMLRRFDHIFCISQKDKRRISWWFHLSNTTAQPVVFPALKVRLMRKSSSSYMLFVGNTKWPPNEDALLWYCSTLHARIIESSPTAMFHIVGALNLRVIRACSRLESNIYIHGFVDSLTKYYQSASVCLLPIRVGAGVKLKALEAMALGIPIIGTRYALDGIVASSGHEYLEAATKEEFSSEVSRIFRHPRLARQLSIQSHLHMRRYHGGKENQFFLKKYIQITEAYCVGGRSK